MTITTHEDWQNFQDSLLFSSQTKPSTSGYYLILCGSTIPITRTTPKNDIIAQELSGNGYVRKQLTSGTLSTVSGNLLRTFPQITHNFSAAKSYRYIVVLANASSTVGDTAGVVVGFYDEGASQVIVSSQDLDLDFAYIYEGTP